MYHPVREKPNSSKPNFTKRIENMTVMEAYKLLIVSDHITMGEHKWLQSVDFATGNPKLTDVHRLRGLLYRVLHTMGEIDRDSSVD